METAKVRKVYQQVDLFTLSTEGDWTVEEVLALLEKRQAWTCPSSTRRIDWVRAVVTRGTKELNPDGVSAIIATIGYHEKESKEDYQVVSPD
jgi:hypothetical protein